MNNSSPGANSMTIEYSLDRETGGAGMLVVIDPRVEEASKLAAGVQKGTVVLILDRNLDAVEQITFALAGNNCTSLHIVCHGAPGRLDLGQTSLNVNNLEQYNQQLQQWRVGDILLYACNLAAGETQANESFLNRLYQLTGANIAASAGRIGNARRGGSWQLEHQMGQISTPLAFGSQLQQAYPGVFAVSFGPATNLGVGNGPISVAVGDFNGDTLPDLAVANANSNNVSVLLNTTPFLSISDVTVTEGNTGSTDANFTVTLSQASGETVTVNYATADGTAIAPGDYTSSSGTLTFAAGVTSQTITVPVVGDTIDEPDETFVVNLTNGSSNARIADNRGTGTIADDDNRPPAIALPGGNPSYTENNPPVVIARGCYALLKPMLRNCLTINIAKATR